MRLLSVLALVLMPLNMAANARSHALPMAGAAHVSDCDMGSQHQSDRSSDTSLCSIACTALPPPGALMLPSSRMTPEVPLGILPNAILDGADLEPTPPPPRSV
jgi:hypothetical protein